MKDYENKLLQEIDRIVWDDAPDGAKIDSLQRLLYQWGQNNDHKTEMMFGSDQRSLEEIHLQQGFRR